jgi:uncharacterized membrane protein YtjA (UPF0391 family)
MEWASIFRQTKNRIVARALDARDHVTARFRNWALSIPAEPNNGIGGQMLRWALGFFIVALIAALLGFTGISLAAAGIAKILFYLFLILFLVTLMGHLLRRS